MKKSIVKPTILFIHLQHPKNYRLNHISFALIPVQSSNSHGDNRIQHIKSTTSNRNPSQFGILIRLMQPRRLTRTIQQKSASQMTWKTCTGIHTAQCFGNAKPLPHLLPISLYKFIHNKTTSTTIK